MEETEIKEIILPFVEDISNSVLYSINEIKECFTVSQWILKYREQYTGTKLYFGEILKIGLDDHLGIRVKFLFLDSNTKRNVSINVFTKQYWIGEVLNEN